MGKLLQLIAKLFGKNAISKTLGTRTNVIKLPGNEQKRLIKDELNIEAASDLAAQKVLKEAEDLIAEIPKMNDQEILTLTGNLQRLDNKLNPPSAEVLDLTTKKPITGEGLEQLAARDGLPADVSPDSPIGRVMQGAQRLRKEKDELDKMLKDPVKQLEQEMQNPYRAGGALDPKMGIVRTAARQVLQKLAREGKINIEDPREAKAIIEGYQGGVDPIEVFRKTFGQDALGDLANLGDELLEIDNRGGSFKELKKILDDEGFFDLQQPKSPAQGMTDEELMKRIKDEDPEGFATGGRVGYSDGGYTFEQFLKDKQQVDEFMSIEELKREYKRMMELKKIRDQRDMVATGGRVGFDDGGILSLEEAKKLNPGMFVDTTTYNPIPENAPNMAADEIAKVIMGTGFLPEEDDELGYPEGMEKPMSSREFIFKSYVVPKRKELMENFGLTMKEADDLIREGMAKYRTNKAIGGRVGFQKGTSKIFDQLEMDVPHPYGHRVNYQIGGPAYDATDPIYGASAITVTPDTIMGPQGNQIQAQMGKPSMTSQFFSGPAFDKYSAERTRSYTQSPSRLQYNLDANKAAGQFIQDRSKEMFGDNIFGKGLGILGTAASVPLAAAISPFHEAAQVIAEGRMEPGSGAKGFYDAFMAEKPFLTAAQRAGGVLQSIPVVGDAVTKTGEKIYDLLNKPTTAQPTFDRKATPTPNAGTSAKFMLYSDPPGTPGRTAIGMVDPNDSKHYGGYDAQGRERFHNPSSDEYDPFSNFKKGSYGDPNYQRPTMADVAGPAATGGGYAGDTKNVVSEDPLGLIQQINKLRNGQTPYANYSYQPEEGGYVAWNGTSYSVVNPEQIKRDIEAIQGLASGGRVGYAYGSGLKLIQLLQKAGKSLKQAIKEAVDNINPTGDKKLDADMAVDDMLETYSIDRDAVDGYDILNAYDEAYKTITNPKTMSEVETLEAMGANITAKTLELVEKYPGLNSELARKIASDPDPQRQADVISMIEQTFKMDEMGMSGDEIIDTFRKKTDRTKQAGGGLSYLSGF
jgi:hypothetical protein